MSALAKLDTMKNIAVRVKASGERRRTVSRQDAIAEELAKAETPSAVGKLAQKWGISDEEVLERAKAAPNFGQFRMVIGNRIRGINRRVQENSNLTRKQAAYPVKRTAAKPKPKAAGAVAKAKPKPATVAKATPKPTPKPTATAKPKPTKVDPNEKFVVIQTQAEAEADATKGGFVIEKVQEYSTDAAALNALRKAGPLEHAAIKGEGENEGKFVLVRYKDKPTTTKAVKKPAAATADAPAA